MGRSEGPTASASADLDRSEGGRGAWWVASMVVLAGLLVATYVRAHPAISPLDETSHVDSLYKASEGSVVRRGDRLDQPALREVACRGINLEGAVVPPCDPDGTYDPGRFGGSGFNNADLHPPTYYFVTARLATALQAVGIADGFVTAGRLVGGMWLALGLVVLWAAGGALLVPPLPRAALAILVASAPNVLHASSIVNPDATALLSGALVLLAAIRWEEGRWRLWTLPAAALVGAAFRTTNLLGAAAVGVYLIVGGIVHRRRGAPARRWWAGAAAVLITVAVAVAGWALIHEAISIAPSTPVIDRFRVSSLGTERLLRESLALVTPLRGAYVPTIFDAGLLGGVTSLFELAILGATVGVPFRRGAWHRGDGLGAAGATSMVGGGLGLALFTFLLFSQYVLTPTRYGISLLPMLVLAVGAPPLRRWVWWVLAILAAAALAVTLRGTLAGGTVGAPTAGLVAVGGPTVGWPR